MFLLLFRSTTVLAPFGKFEQTLKKNEFQIFCLAIVLCTSTKKVLQIFYKYSSLEIKEKYLFFNVNLLTACLYVIMCAQDYKVCILG